MSVLPIFRLEIRHTLRQRLTWAVLGLLLAAMLIGSMVGAARVAAEDATLDRVNIETQQSIATSKAAARRYGRPGSYEVAQFRDPTDAYGYMFNFLTSYATRKPAPLGALTVGQSDLQPGFIRVNFANPFPDSSYELKSPRILALGSFDLGFVLVYLVPLALIALGGTRIAGEQDSGVLRLIAAQPVHPRTVAAAKFGALALIAVPVIALAAPLMLELAGGVGDGVTAFSLLLLVALVALYALFWIAACALAASLWRGAVGAFATLVLGWAVATVLVPTLAALALDLAVPAPSRLAYINESRAVVDRLSAEKGAATRWLAGRHDLASISTDAASSAEVGRLATQRLTRAALAPARGAFDDHAARTEAGSAALRLASPALVLDGALQRLAETDAYRQRLFVAAAGRHAELLRSWFEPRVLAALGKAPACRECPGRLTFAAYDAVPVFRPDARTASLAPAILATLYLAIVTAAVGLIAYRRFARWPS